MCSTIEHIGNYIYRCSGGQKKRYGSKERFIRLLTEYYEGDEFKYITKYYLNNVLSYLIGENPKNPYLIISGKTYYEKLSKYIDIFKKIISVMSENGDKMNIEELEESLANDNMSDRKRISDYLKMLTLANCLCYFGRCPLAHERFAYILNYDLQLGHVGYKFSEMDVSCITFDIIDLAVRKILDKWKKQLISNEIYTYNYPGNDNLETKINNLN